MDRKSTLHDFAAGETGRGPGVPSSLTNNPRSGQWDGRRMSKRMIADYKTFIVTDGEGVRNSLYVSGCPFHCVECFNSSIWDFQAGHEYTQKLEDKIVDDLKAPWIQGITFLGGEPMLNTPVLLPLARRIRGEFGHDKDIWCWTGYTWEELMRPGETPGQARTVAAHRHPRRRPLPQGPARLPPAVPRIQKPAHPRRAAFAAAGRPVVWAKLHDQERDIPEMYLKDREAGEGAQAS